MGKKSYILKFEIINTIFIIILGTILHYTFNWSNQNLFVAIFSPVNESTWEHLKLLFFPMTIGSLIGYFYKGKTYKNYLCAKVKGIILSMIFIIIFFYTYTGILGNNYAFFNILSFIIAVIIGQIYSYNKMDSNVVCNNYKPIVVWAILYICFLIFTFFPPQIGVFKDPITGMYGIFK